jgi:hypothetical protein
VTVTEWLLLSIVLGLVVADVVSVYAWRSLRHSADALRVLTKMAGSSARVTNVTPAATKETVHLVLMDKGEKRVDFVLQVDPAQRAHSVTYNDRMYVCASGSVEDGYFVYRKQ